MTKKKSPTCKTLHINLKHSNVTNGDGRTVLLGWFSLAGVGEKVRVKVILPSKRSEGNPEIKPTT